MRRSRDPGGGRRDDTRRLRTPPEIRLDDDARAIVAGVCAKAGVVWLRPEDEDRHHAAWFVWHADAVHVVAGIGEQSLPPLAGPLDVLVPSKETGARALALAGWGTVLDPGSEAWESAAAALRPARLNATEPAEQRARWAHGALITRIDVTAVTAAGSGADDEPSGAAPPPPSPGTTTSRTPWHLGSRAKARRARRRAAREGDDGRSAERPRRLA